MLTKNRFSVLLQCCLVMALITRPAAAGAQSARPRPLHPHRPAIVRGYYYRPFFDVYPGYLYPWYPFAFAGYPPYGLYAGTDALTSDLKVEVTPRETEVFIDGYLAGVADDFDGFFQRLHVPPGAHEIELHLDGYRSIRQTLYLAPDSTYKLRHTMVKVGPGETSNPRPQPSPPAQQNPPPPASSGNERTNESTPRFGTLSVRVQPADAEVLVDGERWQWPEGRDRLVVHLAVGTHRIEVSKAGYDTFATDAQVLRGETTTLNVSLPAREQR